MEKHADKAARLFDKGCNCAQAVFVAYAEDFGIDRATALRMSAALGGGLGGMRETCGAVSAMALVAGLKYGNSDVSDAEGKAKAMKEARSLAERFSAEHGSIVCKELLGLVPPRGQDAPLPAKKPCRELVRRAAELLAEDTCG